MITVTNSEGEVSRTLGIENYTEPTIPPEKLQEGGQGTSYTVKYSLYMTL